MALFTTFNYKELDSTNDEARRLIKKGFSEGTVVVAETQAKGKGKPGRNWFSPQGSGLYLSAIVKPFKNPSDLSPITLYCARAVVETLKKSAGISAEVKLPNDVLVNGKKVCGILVEGAASGHLIIGIGLNVNTMRGSFPEELKGTATSLKIEAGRDLKIPALIEALLGELEREYLAYLNEV